MESKGERRRRTEHKRRSRIYLEDSDSDEPRVRTNKATASNEKGVNGFHCKGSQGRSVEAPVKTPLPISACNNSRGEHSPQVSGYPSPNPRSRAPHPHISWSR